MHNASSLTAAYSPIHPFSKPQPRWSCSGSRQSTAFQTSFTAATISSSPWGILRRSKARWDMQFLQQVLGLPQALLTVKPARKPLCGGVPIRCPIPTTSAPLSSDYFGRYNPEEADFNHLHPRLNSPTLCLKLRGIFKAGRSDFFTTSRASW